MNFSNILLLEMCCSLTFSRRKVNHVGFFRFKYVELINLKLHIYRNEIESNVAERFYFLYTKNYYILNEKLREKNIQHA